MYILDFGTSEHAILASWRKVAGKYKLHYPAPEKELCNNLDVWKPTTTPTIVMPTTFQITTLLIIV
jgi:hypothetical protein